MNKNTFITLGLWRYKSIFLLTILISFSKRIQCYINKRSRSQKELLPQVGKYDEVGLNSLNVMEKGPLLFNISSISDTKEYKSVLFSEEDLVSKLKNIIKFQKLKDEEFSDLMVLMRSSTVNKQQGNVVLEKSDASGSYNSVCKLSPMEYQKLSRYSKLQTTMGTRLHRQYKTFVPRSPEKTIRKVNKLETKGDTAYKTTVKTLQDVIYESMNEARASSLLTDRKLHEAQAESIKARTEGGYESLKEDIRAAKVIARRKLVESGELDLVDEILNSIQLERDHHDKNKEFGIQKSNQIDLLVPIPPNYTEDLSLVEKDSEEIDTKPIKDINSVLEVQVPDLPEEVTSIESNSKMLLKRKGMLPPGASRELEEFKKRGIRGHMIGTNLDSKASGKLNPRDHIWKGTSSKLDSNFVKPEGFLPPSAKQHVSSKDVQLNTHASHSILTPKIVTPKQPLGNDLLDEFEQYLQSKPIYNVKDLSEAPKQLSN
ncbi:uncharacterized protein CMU_017530 [Cryptosporidium muris RN66]|uniref:Uncharacterized protein n=1 Tax=Cryptosporidium muris (strain RN66) TaxID=441375 RepID=B6ACZ6_CRYMR|nr:uncharacterized protein CMU_017530 [Cryptosporidium muris RN66]EEA06000.1 hypothetical protein CMU_017530 [Cryptosporidium muris RN66]|eukprot:XP_002140349.1 hypothetical protein [Cryptosporidium muris RN66]